MLSAAFILFVAMPAFGIVRWVGGGGAATVVEIVDGDTIRLDDGEQVRLVDLQAQKLPSGRPNFKAWPLADKSKDAHARLALGKRLHLDSMGGNGNGTGGRWPIYTQKKAPGFNERCCV